MRRLALGLSFVVAISVAVLAAGMLLAIGSGKIADVPFYLLFLALPGSLGFVGALLALRRPGNTIGWLLLACGALAGVTFASGEYVRFTVTDGGPGWPLVAPAAWVATWGFLPAVALLVVFLPLLYPTGRLPGRRWRPVALFVTVAITVNTVAAAATPGPLVVPSGPQNFLVVPQPLLGWLQTLAAATNVMVIPVFAAVAGNLLLRFRHSVGIERQQMKWFLFVATIVTAAAAVSLFAPPPAGDVAWLVVLVAMVALPLAIGLAILRHRLFEIDRVISRALGYTVVTGLLGSLFVGIVLVSEALLAPVTRSNSLGVAASTVVVAALFQPLRRTVQWRVDERFDRRRVDADRTVETFGKRLRDATDVDAIDRELLRLVNATVSPAGSALWLRGRTRVPPRDHPSRPARPA